jgi:hypothetical protein
MLSFTWTVPTAEIASESERLDLQLEAWAREAMHEAIQYAALAARSDHENLAGWENESGNLERSITGYVAGDPESEVYPYGGSVPLAPFKRGRDSWGLVRDQQYLSDHYRADPAVSPPVEPEPEKVIGILHKYMQYANYLPSTPKVDGRRVTVDALEEHAEDLFRILESVLGKAFR